MSYASTELFYRGFEHYKMLKLDFEHWILVSARVLEPILLRH